MQVGDLVRVYDFSKRARVARAACGPVDEGQYDVDSEAYTLGLIVQDTSMYRNWRVQLLQYPEVREIYQEDRLEVESASR